MNERPPSGARVIERFPGFGAKPFADEPGQHLTFFGRPHDIERMVESIRATRLTVLYGVSGLGKTSLLQAGVFPRLRDVAFIPVPIRVCDPGRFTAVVLEAVQEACAHAGAELVAGDRSGAWEFFSTSVIWRGEDVATPVLVFDQFEEIFALSSDGRHALAAEIGALAAGVAPERVRAEALAAAEGGSRTTRAKPPELRVVLSLREEDFGALQDLALLIPGLFDARVRLAPLTREQAREAVEGPAGLADDKAPSGERFAGPPFAFDEDARKILLDFLEGDAHEIEPWEIQQVCAHLEKEVVPLRAGDGPLVLRREDITAAGALDVVLENFYLKATATLPGAQHRRARVLCEQGLLTPAGRRQMREANQLLSDYRVTQETLDTLDTRHVIRRVRRLGGVHYELTHDRLAEAIAHVRPWWRLLPHRYTVAFGMVVPLVVVFLVLAVAWVTQIRAARQRAEGLVEFLIGDQFLEKIRPLGRIAILSEVQRKVEVYLEQTGARDSRTFALAHRNAADLLHSKGDLRNAEREYRAAAAAFERLRARHDSAVELEAARTYRELGSILAQQGRIADAIAEQRRATALAEAALEARHDRVATLELARASSELGSALVSQGDPEAALRNFERVLALVEPLHRPDDWEVLLAIHDGLDGKAQCYREMGRGEDANHLYAKGLALAEQLLQTNPLAPETHFRMLVAVSRVLPLLNSTDQARYWTQLYGECTQLVQHDPANRQWHRERAVVRMHLARAVAANTEDGRARERALREIRLAREELRQLTEVDPANADWNADLASTLELLGELAGKGDPTGTNEAARANQAALMHREEIARIDSSNADALAQLAMLHLTLCRLGPVAERVEHCARARRTFGALAQAHRAEVWYVVLLSAAARAEDGATAIGAPSGSADGAQREVAAIVEAARVDNPHHAALSANEALKSAREAGRTTEALESYARAMKLLRDAAARAPGDSWFPLEVARVSCQQAGVQLAADDSEAAERSCVEAIEAANEASRLTPWDVGAVMEVANAHFCKAATLAARDLGGSRVEIDEAIGAARRAVNLEESEDQPRKLLIRYLGEGAALASRAGDAEAIDAAYTAIVTEATEGHKHHRKDAEFLSARAEAHLALAASQAFAEARDTLQKALRDAQLAKDLAPEDKEIVDLVQRITRRLNAPGPASMTQ